MSSVYFGNDIHQAWIKAPQTGLKAINQGWSSETQLLNGRTHIRRSEASHRRFTMNWIGPMNDVENSLHIVRDFANGLYGDGPFFWNDPYATTSNLFDPTWASPALTIDSNIAGICPDGVGVTKTKILTSSEEGVTALGNNTQDYPAYTAKFVAPGSPTLESNKFTFYIPEGYTLWLGMHGSHGTAGAASYKPYKNGTAGTVANMTPLTVTSTSRVNTPISSSTADKVEVYLRKITSGSCTFYVNAFVAQLLKTGVSPTPGKFVSGRGTTGLEFASLPEIEYYSANINNGQIGMSVTMAEI